MADQPSKHAAGPPVPVEENHSAATGRARLPLAGRNDSKLSIAAALVGMGSALFGVYGWWEGHHEASEATKAQPNASIVNIAGSRVVEGSARTYTVGSRTNLSFSFHQGKTDLQPLIVVWASDPKGSGKFYPIDPVPLRSDGAKCPGGTSDDAWYCGDIFVGSSQDKGIQFTVSIYGVPSQIAGIVRAKVQQNVESTRENGWSNLPGLTPLDSITVKRE